MIPEPWLMYCITGIGILLAICISYILVDMAKDMAKQGVFQDIWWAIGDWVFWLRLGLNLAGYTLTVILTWQYPLVMGVSYLALVLALLIAVLCIGKDIKSFLYVWRKIHTDFFPILLLSPLAFLPARGNKKHPTLPIDRVSSRKR